MSTLWAEIVAVVLLILFSALYSGAETALTTIGTDGARKLLESDPKKYRTFKLWVTHPFQALTAILVGNTLANISVATLVTHIILRSFQDLSPAAALAISIGSVTLVVLALCEISAKAASRVWAAKAALPAMRLVWFTNFFAAPLTKPLMRFTKLGLRLTGQDFERLSQLMADDKVSLMVDLAREDGSLSVDQEELLENVRDFAETIVKEIMIPRVDVVSVPETCSYEDLLKTLVKCGHSRIPVYRESIDHIIGIYYAKDMLRNFAAGMVPKDFKLLDCLREPLFVPTSKNVDTLFRELQNRRVHMAVVVDEFGGTAGVVTLEDIMEELFGEIQDEYDHEKPMLIREGPDRNLADARISLAELEAALGLKFPDEHDYESLGGFISDRLGTVPEPGENFVYGGYELTVVESKRTHIVSVRIKAITAAVEIVKEPEETEPTNGG